MIHLVVTNQTKPLIGLIQQCHFQININSAINFRGDTLLHYACAKNNVELAKYLLGRPDILKTTKNYLKQEAKQLTSNKEINRLCS